jgi:hypothetical protein
MTSFRSKPIGWRYESHRHSLAAKGIKTKYMAGLQPNEEDNRRVTMESEKLKHAEEGKFSEDSDPFGSRHALMFEADREIEKNSSLALDVAEEHGQIFDNVKHMSWFKNEVADRIRDDRDALLLLRARLRKDQTSLTRYNAKMSDKDVLKNTQLISEKAELVRLKQKQKVLEQKYKGKWTEDAYEEAKELQDDIERLEESVEEHENPTVFRKTGKKYMSEAVPDKYDKIAGFLKSAVDDGRAKVPDFHQQHKLAVENEMFQRYRGRFAGAESAGQLRDGATKTFMEDDLTNELKDYHDSKIDERTLRSNLERRADKHEQQYGAKMKLFDFGESETGEQMSLLPDALNHPKKNKFFARREEASSIMRIGGQNYVAVPEQDVYMNVENPNDILSFRAADEMADEARMLQGAGVIPWEASGAVQAEYFRPQPYMAKKKVRK